MLLIELETEVLGVEADGTADILDLVADAPQSQDDAGLSRRLTSLIRPPVCCAHCRMARRRRIGKN